MQRRPKSIAGARCSIPAPRSVPARSACIAQSSLGATATASAARSSAEPGVSLERDAAWRESRGWRVRRIGICALELRNEDELPCWVAASALPASAAAIVGDHAAETVLVPVACENGQSSRASPAGTPHLVGRHLVPRALQWGTIPLSAADETTVMHTGRAPIGGARPGHRETKHRESHHGQEQTRVNRAARPVPLPLRSSGCLPDATARRLRPSRFDVNARR